MTEEEKKKTGNLTACATPDVLRKVLSEKVNSKLFTQTFFKRCISYNRYTVKLNLLQTSQQVPFNTFQYTPSKSIC